MLFFRNSILPDQPKAPNKAFDKPLIDIEHQKPDLKINLKSQSNKKLPHSHIIDKTTEVELHFKQHARL